MPNFVPKPGQIDFTHARWAPVVVCAVQHGEKILVVKRSAELNFYPNLWNGIGGFLDDHKSLEEKVYEEFSEELGLEKEAIESIFLGEIFDMDDPELKKTWVIHPILVKVSTDQVKLDWEAQEYKWVSIEEARSMDLLPSFHVVLDKVFKNK
jgi:8-oxo-dGTP pyrophosphatase MutT (NUDIX family)